MAAWQRRISTGTFCNWTKRRVLLVINLVVIFLLLYSTNADLKQKIYWFIMPLKTESDKQIHSSNVESDEIHAQSQRNKTCVHPKLSKNYPAMMRFVKKYSPPKCTDEEWLRVANGSVFFSENAMRFYENLTCDYYPLLRVDEDGYKYGTPIMNISDGFMMVSDFFKGACRDTNNFTNIGIYAGVTQSVEREERSDNADPLSLGFQGMSIAILGFDSMSRMSWYRRLKDTREFFKDDLGAIELESHNIVGDGTTAVMFPMLTGKFEWELPGSRTDFRDPETMDKIPFLWHDMKNAGYLTSWCNADPVEAPFNYRFPGFGKQPTDFYTRPYFQAVKEMNSTVKNCVGGRTLSRVWLDYFKDVFVTFPQQRKFLIHFLTDLSHSDNNPITMMDTDIRDLVKFLHEGNYLNNTLLILMGDHGSRYSKFRYTYSGKMEERLPYFGFLFPPWFEEKYPQAIKNLRTNTQRLTTPFDLYETFKDFFHFDGAGVGDVKKRGISLFKEIPLSRSCKDADIAPHWCACLDWKDVSPNDTSVKEALQAALDTINGYTAPYRDDCALLSVQTVMASSELKANKKLLTHHHVWDKSSLRFKSKHVMVLYQISFTTRPGGASFEVTVTYNTVTKEFSLSKNDISRINRYGDDPACILGRNKHVRAYCYCKKY